MTSNHIAELLAVVSRVNAQGGPRPKEYSEVLAVLNDAERSLRDVQLSSSELDSLRSGFGAALGPETMQGRAWLKRYGYAGDFEIIDQTYLEKKSNDLAFRGRALPTVWWRPEGHRRSFDRLRTGVEEPAVIVRILTHLGLPARARSDRSASK